MDAHSVRFQGPTVLFMGGVPYGGVVSDEHRVPPSWSAGQKGLHSSFSADKKENKRIWKNLDILGLFCSFCLPKPEGLAVPHPSGVPAGTSPVPVGICTGLSFPPGEQHQPVAEVVGLFRGEDGPQLVFHLHRVLAVAEAQQVGDADAVGVADDGGLPTEETPL